MQTRMLVRLLGAAWLAKASGCASTECSDDEWVSISFDGCNTESYCPVTGEGYTTQVGCSTWFGPGGSCYHLPCVADIEPETPGLQVNCSAYYEILASADFDETPIQLESGPLPKCTDDGAQIQIPDGEESCFQIRTGNEIDPLCAAELQEVDFRFHFRTEPPENWWATVWCDHPSIEEYATDPATCHGPGEEWERW